MRKKSFVLARKGSSENKFPNKIVTKEAYNLLVKIKNAAEEQIKFHRSEENIIN